jgi:hypothetical protein
MTSSPANRNCSLLAGLISDMYKPPSFFVEYYADYSLAKRGTKILREYQAYAWLRRIS